MFSVNHYIVIICVLVHISVSKTGVSRFVNVLILF